MRSRDNDILHHVGLYRVSLRYVIEQLFFEGGNCGNVIQRLLNQKRLQSVPGLHGSLRYYQLTLSEARQRNLPQDRGRALGPRALASHMALLWYCFRADVPRRRLEHTELARLFEDLDSGCPHVAEAGARPCVLRVHVVSPKTRTADIIKRLRVEVEADSRTETLTEWVASRRYAYALLVTSRPRADALNRAVHRVDLGKRAQVRCDYVPCPITIYQVIQNAKREPSSRRD